MKNFIVAISLVLIINKSFSQGCSDAGFCTLNGFKPNSIDSTKSNRNEISVGFSLGNADFNISTYGAYIAYKRVFNNSLSIDLKITSTSQNGNNISNSGLSDVYITSNYKLNRRIGLTSGFKLPLNDGNQLANSLPLPLDYQSSLGTIDYLLGINLSILGLQIVGAWQQPLTQNKSEFLSEIYPADLKFSEFQSTNNFKRAGDILLRFSYPIKFFNKLTITPGLLLIYHLDDDYYTTINGKEIPITGSEGLTLNTNLYIDYKINSNQNLQMNGGIPFIVRTARPDGLTRSLVVAIEFKQRF